MKKNTLKFGNIRLNKKEFLKSQKPIDLMSVSVDQIVVSDKFKHSEECYKYFIDYQEGEIIKLLCIILPQMNGYIKYFENGDKNISFLIKDEEVLDKYEQSWDVTKTKLSIKFHSEPVYDEICIKAKLREFDGVIKTKFWGNDVSKENKYYTCIACVNIDSVMRTDKKNHPQINLEECKYRVKKIQMSRFINTEVKSDSDLEPDSEVESKSDVELMTKLKSDSDSE